MNEEKEQGKIPLESQAVNKRDGRPHYLFELEKRWIRWTDIQDPDILEALDYLSGDLFFEMRKLTSQSCLANEEAEKRMIRKLSASFNLQDNREKLREVAQIVFDCMQGEKEGLKGLIDKSWRDIVDKQKVGIDKVCIVVTKHIFDKVKEKSDIITQNNGKTEEKTTPTAKSSATKRKEKGGE